MLIDDRVDRHGIHRMTEPAPNARPSLAGRQNTWCGASQSRASRFSSIRRNKCPVYVQGEFQRTKRLKHLLKTETPDQVENIVSHCSKCLNMVLCISTFVFETPVMKWARSFSSGSRDGIIRMPQATVIL